MAAFNTYLEFLEDKDHLLLNDKNGRLMGWLVCFIRENERWFAMAIDQSAQGKGLGSALLNRARKRYPSLNGWVIDSDTEPKQNGEYYMSPIAFYLKNGFEIKRNVKLTKNGISGIQVKWNQ